MADSKITALTALTAADPVNDMFPVVDVSDTSMAASGTTKKISVNNILGASGTATLASATITGALVVDTTTLVVDATNNRVGIGTASPTVPLDVLGSGDGELRLRAGSDSALIFSETTANKNYKVKSSGGDLAFQYSATAYNSGYATPMILTASGNLLVGVTSANANGGVLQLKSGITFPATQVAASDANTLDDYEEGTWTGTLKGSVSNPTIAVTATGTYTKVGRKVTVNINYNNVSTVGASGNVSIDGLPFNGPQNFAGSSIAFDLFATSTTLASWNAGTEIEFFILGAYSKAQHNPGTGRYLTTTITYNV